MTAEINLTVLTRDEPGNTDWATRFESHDIQTYSLPCIETIRTSLTPAASKILQSYRQYDWLVFTSPRSVRYFFELLTLSGLSVDDPASPKVAVVGNQTAAIARDHGLPVNFWPSHENSDTLGRDLPDVQTRNILLLRSSRATRALVELLEGRGATITNLTTHTLNPVTTPDPRFDELVRSAAIARIVCASPSAVEGLRARVAAPDVWTTLQALPAIATGPATARALKAYRFKNISLATSPSAQGVINLL